jgi:hypothetical protein
MKPKTALVAIRLTLLALLWVWPFGHSVLYELMLIAILGSLLIDAVYYLSGLRFVEHAGKYLISLLISPLLLVLWVISWGFSLLPSQEWLRAREK